MSNFLTRTLTGAVFVILVIGTAIWNVWAFTAVFAMFTVCGIWEFFLLVSKTGIKPFRIYGTAIAFSVYAITALAATGLIGPFAPLCYLIVFSISFLFFFAELYLRSATPFHNIAYTFLGIIYLAIPFSMLIAMVNVGYGSFGIFTFPVFYFFMIWANDTFAYLVGSAIGKHRLFERISPKKSWEGAIGGLFFTFILAFIFSRIHNYFTLPQWLGLAAVIVVFGNFGDLAESMFKRSIGVKDSGKFFPGHGGILDRFDSVLLSAPFVFVYLQIILIFK
jgi:phosphatidate cytidylyltransferase